MGTLDLVKLKTKQKGLVEMETPCSRMILMFPTGHGCVDEWRQLVPAGENCSDHQQGAKLRIQESQGICKSHSAIMPPAFEDCISIELLSKSWVLKTTSMLAGWDIKKRVNILHDFMSIRAESLNQLMKTLYAFHKQNECVEIFADSGFSSVDHDQCYLQPYTSFYPFYPYFPSYFSFS